MTIRPPELGGGRPAASLAAVEGVLAVVAHPDDESFGLGAVVAALTADGVPCSVLCLTHGEASTLHGVPGELATVREQELTNAIAVLGVGAADLLDYPDGGLSQVPVDDLVAHVDRLIGHPDHARATEAALAAARRQALPVLGWAVPDLVAATLNTEFGTSFAGRPVTELTAVAVDRTVQRRAIDCHRSQSTDNPVLLRRLQLLDDVDYVRVLFDPGSAA